jgi:pimeloyl-ACP methyl ester carboxylesterase
MDTVDESVEETILTTRDTQQPTRRSWSPKRSRTVGGTLLISVVALVGCGGGGGPADSMVSAQADAVATSTAPASVADGGVLVVEDELYRKPTSADGAGSTVDIFVGDRSEGGPVVVLLHGFGMSGAGRPLVDLGPLGQETARLGATVFYFGWQTTQGFQADSVADMSCVGPFVAARAAEFGADPDKVIVVGHSMGAETGSMLAFSSFDPAPSPDCTETGQASSPVAFLGIGGTYGMVGGPIDDDHTRFRSRSYPRGTFQEYDADQDIVPGLTGAQAYQLDGYRAIPPVAELDIVLVVGSEDQYPATNADITATFADALEANNVDVEVVTVEGANHENIADPTTAYGQATLRAIADILANAR